VDVSGDADDPDLPTAAGPSNPAAEATEVPSARTSVAAKSADAERCPACGAKRIADDVFCEECGHDFVADSPGSAPGPRAAEWSALVIADREHFARGDWPGLEFPELSAPHHVALDRSEIRIGRGELPTGPPELDLDDPAVSRLHAILVQDDDGSYAVVDKGSTNGTTLNGDAAPLVPNVPVSLAHGDRVHVGAWTTIQLRRVADEGLERRPAHKGGTT
jgi:hypothetical protein